MPPVGKRSSQAAVVVVALSAAACSAAAPLSAQVRQSYLDAVYSQAPDIGGYRSGAQLVAMGQAICSDLGAGANVEQVADRVPLVEGNRALPPGDLGVVISAAVGSICPGYRKALSG